MVEKILFVWSFFVWSWSHASTWNRTQGMGAYLCPLFTSFALDSVSYAKIWFILPSLAQNLAPTLGYFDRQVAASWKQIQIFEFDPASAEGVVCDSGHCCQIRSDCIARASVLANMSARLHHATGGNFDILETSSYIWYVFCALWFHVGCVAPCTYQSYLSSILLSSSKYK